MAKAEKYRYQFKTLEGQTCTVRFDFEGFTGASTTLVGADKPFTLQEFNTDEDLFKPLRPQLATMNILASSTGVTIDDFLMDNDDDVIVYFDFGSWTNYWIGYLQQDDFQETWIDTNHIITIRASEGIGLLKDKQITDFGAELSGKYNFLELIERGMAGTVQSFAEYYVFSGLFHDSMANYGYTDTGLDQCYTTAKTFQINPSEYDTSYTALEKINRSWNQTLYMYDGVWYIQRLEELYTASTNNIIGYAQTLLGRNNASRRFDINVGVNGDIKPITPEMLRFIQRRTKKDIVQFDFNQINEIVCNGAFNRGQFVSSTNTEKVYELSEWSWKQGTLGSPTTPSTGSFGRKELYESATGRLTDQFAYISQDASTNRFIKSCGIEVLQGETFNFSIDHRYDLTFAGTATIIAVYFQLVGTSNNYTLDDDGRWYQSNASFTTNLKGLSVYYNGTPGILPTDWTTSQVKSDPLPESGTLYISLWCFNTPTVTNQFKYYKNLQLNLYNSFNGIDVSTIDAIQSIFTKTDELRKEYSDTIFFDDGFSKVYKGSIFEDDELTLTDRNWFRRRYDTERLGFRKQNAVTHWEHNRFNRNKIDANFYGLTWDGGNKPIGLVNTLIFTDDDPDKVYGIVNIKEIDFSSSTWSATIEEVWDDNKDAGAIVTKTFDADPVNGNYLPFSEFNIPYTIVSAADVTYDSINKKFTYNGPDVITELMTVTLTGDINAINPLNTTATFKLYINDTQVASTTHDASTTPSQFSIALSGTYTISPGQNMYVTISSNVGDFDVNGGQWTFSYDVNQAQNYDPYEDKYLYK